MQTDPRWLDRRLFPFTPHYFQLPQGRVHYVDEGAGEPILFLHGNPTWSFLYRHLIECLKGQYRCVAPDYLGFGLSDKPATGFSYQPHNHARIVEALIEELGLRDVTLVVQDWGGPIGLRYAVDHPQNVKRIVAMNTFAWPLDTLSDAKMQVFSTLLGNPLGSLLIKRLNLFAKGVMPSAYADRSKLTEHIHAHYTGPLDDPQARAGSAVMPKALLSESDWLNDIYARRDVLRDLPMLLVWGMDDPAFGGMLPRWKKEFPNAEAVELPDVGHYVQEEAHDALCRILPDWFARTPLPLPTNDVRLGAEWKAAEASEESKADRDPDAGHDPTR